jgi:hypothetical protein
MVVVPAHAADRSIDIQSAAAKPRSSQNVLHCDFGGLSLFIEASASSSTRACCDHAFRSVTSFSGMWASPGQQYYPRIYPYLKSLV